MEFGEIVRDLKRKTDWIDWLSQDTSKPAIETLAFLSTCYTNIPQTKKTKLAKRLQKGDQQEVDAILRELVAHELLRRLGLQPTWSPSIDGLNPDLAFHANGRKFIADVLIVKSPMKTLIRKHENFIEFWDNPSTPGESRANKIAEKIGEKSSKYSKLEFPLVLLIFLGDNFLLDVEKVEAALFGKTIEDIEKDKRYPNGESYDPFYPNLAAVIACKWFDTNNLADEGRRLRCVVLHNWATEIPLPTDAFSKFGQVIWKANNEMKQPQYFGDKNMVAKFQDENILNIKPYSSSAPW